MKNPVTILTELTRPSLLIRAARHGVAQYNRQRDLHRLTGGSTPTCSEAALSILIDEEAQVEAARKDGLSSYRVTDHIALLIAMMGEARLVPRLTD